MYIIQLSIQHTPKIKGGTSPRSPHGSYAYVVYMYYLNIQISCNNMIIVRPCLINFMFLGQMEAQIHCRVGRTAKKKRKNYESHEYH